MSETNRCPRCQAEIPAGAPEGLCPACLLQAALDPKTDDAAPKTAAYSASGSKFVPPTPETLQSAFPQLEILELLGKGGMGAVYKARQQGLDRFVAVKILPPEFSQDPTFIERFTREARALAKLSHPNIVAVYDFGQTSGYCYFVMEFVDGVNLRQAMRAGTLKSAEALKIVPQICDALQFAHDEGIVHRDIKPENILLDKKGRVKIADFGLAKLMGKMPADVSLTGTQQVMGTMHYMAPEQLEGSRDVDHRADIYSLGVTFYEMLTGELPIGRFAAPSKKVQIDVRLDEVVLRSLEKEPELRYQQASEIKTDVERIGAAQPPVSPVAAPAVEGALEQTIVDLLPEEREEAVRKYREATGAALADAVRAVRAIAVKHGLEHMPFWTPHFLLVCAGPVVGWIAPVILFALLQAAPALIFIIGVGSAVGTIPWVQYHLKKRRQQMRWIVGGFGDAKAVDDLKKDAKSPEQPYQHASEIKPEVEGIVNTPPPVPAGVSAAAPDDAEQAYWRLPWSMRLSVWSYQMETEEHLKDAIDHLEDFELAYLKLPTGKKRLVAYYRRETGADLKNAMTAVAAMDEIELAVLVFWCDKSLAVKAYRAQTGAELQDATAAVEAIAQKYGIHLDPVPPPPPNPNVVKAVVIIATLIVLGIFAALLYMTFDTWLFIMGLIGLPMIGTQVFAAIMIFHEWWIRPSPFLIKLWRTSLLIVGAASVLIFLNPLAYPRPDGGYEITVGIWPWLSHSTIGIGGPFQVFASWSLLAFPVGWLAFWAYRQSFVEAKHDLEKKPEQRHQRANEVETHIEGNVGSNLPESTVQALTPAATGGIPVSYYFKTMGLAALAWLLVPLLWNAREWGLAIMCLTIGAFIVWRARGIMQFLPASAERWRQRSRIYRQANTIMAVLMAAAGVYFVFLAGYQAWDRCHWNSMARTRDEFQQVYRGSEHHLLHHLPEFDKDIPRAELGMAHLPKTFPISWNLSISNPPSVDLFANHTICVSFFMGVFIFTLVYFGFMDPGATWSWQFRWIWPSLGLSLATLAPVLPYAFHLLVIWTLPGYSFIENPMAVKDDLPVVAAQLDDWAAANGYESGDIAAGEVYLVPRGGKLASIQIRHLWRPNVFDRWEMTWRGLKSNAPDYAVTLIGSATTKQSVVLQSRRLSEWNQPAIALR